MLSQKLKEQTKTNHQLVEKKLVSRMRAIQTNEDYAAFLAVFYTYFGGLELGIDKFFDVACLPDYPQRRKSKALTDDLIQLGAALPSLAPSDDLPAIHNHLQAMGALYVIEGSTLGGKIICKIMSGQLKLTKMEGLSFFNGYGEETDRMWEVFKQFIDQPLSAINEDVVIQSANDTFTKFGEWFDRSTTSVIC